MAQEESIKWPVLTGYSFRSADEADALAISHCVNAAYGRYIDRIGGLPGPMTDDYEQIIKECQVTIAESGGRIAGILVLKITDEGFLLQNVAVHPHHRSVGLGRVLLRFAETEARRHGFDSIYLYTHEKMVENEALYTGLGYVEYDRRTAMAGRRPRDTSFIPTLVYMRKQLGVLES